MIDKKGSFIRQTFWLWIILIHAVWFWVSVTWGRIYTRDSLEYLYQAHNLKSYFSNYCWDIHQAIKTEFYTRRPVLYGAILVLLKWIWNSDIFVLIVQNALSLLNIYFLKKILTGFRFGFNIHLTLILALALYPTWFVYTDMIMTEQWLISCLLFAFYFILKYLQDKKLKNIILYNLCITLGVLLKPVLMYFWIPNLILLLYFFYKDRRIAIPLSGMLMVAAIVIHSLANYKVTGYYHYSSIKNFNLLHYNTVILLKYVKNEEWAGKQADSIESLALKQPDFKSYNEFIEKECFKIHLAHPFILSKNMLGGMADFFIDPGHHDMEQFLPSYRVSLSFFDQMREKGVHGLGEYLFKMPWREMGWMIPLMIWNFFVAISFFFFLFNRKVQKNIRLIVFLIFSYIWVLTGPMGYSRFKMPVYFLLMFTIPFFIEQIKNRKKRAV